MKKILAHLEMQRLIGANLYISDGKAATPDYRYCKPEAPVYVRQGRLWIAKEGE